MVSYYAIVLSDSKFRSVLQFSCSDVNEPENESGNNVKVKFGDTRQRCKSCTQTFNIDDVEKTARTDYLRHSSQPMPGIIRCKALYLANARSYTDAATNAPGAATHPALQLQFLCSSSSSSWHAHARISYSLAVIISGSASATGIQWRIQRRNRGVASNPRHGKFNVSKTS